MKMSCEENSPELKIICNTTPFIALASIDRVGLMEKLYEAVSVPEAVIEEVRAGGPIRVPDLTSLKWIHVISNVTTHEHKLLYQLDYGERNVILNALKMDADLVLIDDRIARNIAEHMGLHVKGTLGVLVDAKRKGLIASFEEMALEMRENGIRLSLRLIREISSALEEEQVP